MCASRFVLAAVNPGSTAETEAGDFRMPRHAAGRPGCSLARSHAGRPQPGAPSPAAGAGGTGGPHGSNAPKLPQTAAPRVAQPRRSARLLKSGGQLTAGASPAARLQSAECPQRGARRHPDRQGPPSARDLAQP